MLCEISGDVVNLGVKLHWHRQAGKVRNAVKDIEWHFPVPKDWSAILEVRTALGLRRSVNSKTNLRGSFRRKRQTQQARVDGKVAGRSVSSLGYVLLHFSSRCYCQCVWDEENFGTVYCKKVTADNGHCCSATNVAWYIGKNLPDKDQQSGVFNLETRAKQVSALHLTCGQTSTKSGWAERGWTLYVHWFCVCEVNSENVSCEIGELLTKKESCPAGWRGTHNKKLMPRLSSHTWFRSCRWPCLCWYGGEQVVLSRRRHWHKFLRVFFTLAGNLCFSLWKKLRSLLLQSCTLRVSVLVFVRIHASMWVKNKSSFHQLKLLLVVD